MAGGWTAADIPDLNGRRAIITGANSGLGFHVALELARNNAEVVLACRNAERAEQAVAQIRTEVPHAKADKAVLDLADLNSVNKFADEYGSQHDELDLLVNNAGVMALPREVTADGFEMQLGTNHLGHYALTGRLLPLLLSRPDARIVTVTSLLHKYGKIHFDDLHGERNYGAFAAYYQSKLANLLFMVELDRRLKRAGNSTISVGAHPGYSVTNLLVSNPHTRRTRRWDTIWGVLNTVFAQPVEFGRLPLLHAATAPGIISGECYGPLSMGQARGRTGRVKVAPQVFDSEVARRLWEVSAELTKVTYDSLAYGTSSDAPTATD